MVTRTIIKSITVASLCIGLLACGKKESHDHAASGNEPAAPAAVQFQVDPEFKKQLTTVFDNYATLKDALVSSDAAKVKQEATATLGALDKVDMKLVSGAAHHDWMTYQGSMQGALRDISAAGDLATQRLAFSTLSNELYKTIKAYGLSGETAYYEYCPMAFDNKGGYWLAKESQIRNPYFGDEMLTCGSVQETLR